MSFTLPTPGGDTGVWGAELNAYLNEMHARVAFNPRDYGAMGDGSDDRAAILATFTAAAAAGNRCVVFTLSPSGASYHMSTGIDIGALGSNWKVIGASWQTSGAIQDEPPAVGITCASGPAFHATTGSGYYFDNLRFSSLDTAFKFTGCTQVHITRCAVQVNANGGVDTCPIIFESCFETWVTGCALDLAAITLTLASTYNAGTDTSISLTDATNAPTAGEAGFPFGTGGQRVRWTGKSTNTLTGVTLLTGASGAIASGTTMEYRSPAITYRGVNASAAKISYIGRVKECILHGGHILYDQQVDPSGPIVNDFIFEDNIFENINGPLVELRNSWGTTLQFAAFTFRHLNDSDAVEAGFQYGHTVRVGNHVTLVVPNVVVGGGDVIGNAPFFDVESGGIINGGFVSGLATGVAPAAGAGTWSQILNLRTNGIYKDNTAL